MKFGNYKKNSSEETLTEAKQREFARVQPKIGKPAVDKDSLPVPESMVITLNLLLVASQTTSGAYLLIDYRSGKLIDTVDLKLLQKHLRSLK